MKNDFDIRYNKSFKLKSDILFKKKIRALTINQYFPAKQNYSKVQRHVRESNLKKFDSVKQNIKVEKVKHQKINQKHERILSLAQPKNSYKYGQKQIESNEYDLEKIKDFQTPQLQYRNDKNYTKNLNKIFGQEKLKITIQDMQIDQDVEELLDMSQSSQSKTNLNGKESLDLLNVSEINDLLEINSCSDSDTQIIDIQSFSNKSLTSLRVLFLDSEVNKKNQKLKTETNLDQYSDQLQNYRANLQISKVQNHEDIFKNYDSFNADINNAIQNPCKLKSDNLLVRIHQYRKNYNTTSDLDTQIKINEQNEEQSITNKEFKKFALNNTQYSEKKVEPLNLDLFHHKFLQIESEIIDTQRSNILQEINESLIFQRNSQKSITWQTNQQNNFSIQETREFDEKKFEEILKNTINKKILLIQRYWRFYKQKQTLFNDFNKIFNKFLQTQNKNFSKNLHNSQYKVLKNQQKLLKKQFIEYLKSMNEKDVCQQSAIKTLINILKK